MVRWLRWHCPPDTGFEIRALAVWGRARYLSVTETPHNTDFHTWMGKKHFLFLSNRRDREPNPELWRERRVWRSAFPANKRCWPNGGLMLRQRLRRWTNVSQTLGQHFLFAGLRLRNCWRHSPPLINIHVIITHLSSTCLACTCCQGEASHYEGVDLAVQDGLDKWRHVLGVVIYIVKFN